MRKSILLLLVVPLLFASCVKPYRGGGPDPSIQTRKVWGFKPVYTRDTTVLQVKFEAARANNRPAKIYVKGNIIFQNDIGSGIHVIDNSDPRNPRKIGFLKVLGSSEISIKGNYLYTNMLTDLLVVDVSDWQHPVIVKRVKDAFYQGYSAGNGLRSTLLIPLPEKKVYYDCSLISNKPEDILTGWVRDSIYQNCYYP